MQITRLSLVLTTGVLITVIFGCDNREIKTNDAGNQVRETKGRNTMDDSYSITITRDMNAPVERVWAAWNSREKIAKWWGPAGFSSTVKQLDVRDGGHFEVIMHGPNGVDYPNVYIFEHVEKFKQLVYLNTGSKEFGLAPFQTVFSLEKLGNQTHVTLKARFSSEEDKRKHVEQFHAIEGAQQLLQRLEEQAK